MSEFSRASNVIDELFYSQGVYKDTPLAVGQVRATDEDADGANSLFGQLRYSIVNSSGK